MARLVQAAVPFAVTVGLLVVAVLLVDHVGLSWGDAEPCEIQSICPEGLPLLLLPAVAWTAAGMVPVVAVAAIVCVTMSFVIAPRRPQRARLLRWAPAGTAALVVVAVALPLGAMTALS